jgi:hypothetical protein
MRDHLLEQKRISNNSLRNSFQNLLERTLKKSRRKREESSLGTS